MTRRGQNTRSQFLSRPFRFVCSHDKSSSSCMTAEALIGSRAARTGNTEHRDCSQRAPAVHCHCHCLVDLHKLSRLHFYSPSLITRVQHHSTTSTPTRSSHSLTLQNVCHNTSVSSQQYLPRPHRTPAKQRPLRAPQSSSTPSRNQQCAALDCRIRRCSARRSRLFHDILPTTYLQDQIER